MTNQIVKMRRLSPHRRGSRKRRRAFTDPRESARLFEGTPGATVMRYAISDGPYCTTDSGIRPLHRSMRRESAWHHGQITSSLSWNGGRRRLFQDCRSNIVHIGSRNVQRWNFVLTRRTTCSRNANPVQRVTHASRSIVEFTTNARCPIVLADIAVGDRNQCEKLSITTRVLKPHGSSMEQEPRVSGSEGTLRTPLRRR